MSYDIRFGVKGDPNGRVYVVFEPERAHPTYNIGKMLRKAMQWDFEQSKWYKVSDIIWNLEHGLQELKCNPMAYKQYEPDNGWGSVDSAIECLSDVVKTIKEHIAGWDWNDYDMQYLWMSW